MLIFRSSGPWVPPIFKRYDRSTSLSEYEWLSLIDSLWKLRLLISQVFVRKHLCSDLVRFWTISPIWRALCNAPPIVLWKHLLGCGSCCWLFCHWKALCSVSSKKAPSLPSPQKLHTPCNSLGLSHLIFAPIGENAIYFFLATYLGLLMKAGHLTLSNLILMFLVESKPLILFNFRIQYLF